MFFKSPRNRFLLIFLTLCILLIFTSCPVAAASTDATLSSGEVASGAGTGHWPTLDEVQGQAWIVLDATTGKVLLEKNADQQAYPASTTKIMTAILALESGQLNKTVTVSAAAVCLSSSSSKAGYVAGERVVLHDVLYGLMLPSGNDAANILAEALGGDQAGFAAKMNQKAKTLGMKNSHFFNPSGIHEGGHVVTARDMATLAAYAMKNTEFRKIVSTATYSLPASNKHPLNGWAMLVNTNKFLLFGDTALQSDLLDHYEGIKTGSTDFAGNNLVSAAKTKSGHELICVLFGAPLSTKMGNTFVYSRTLLEEAAKKIKPSTGTSSQSGTTGSDQTSNIKETSQDGKTQTSETKVTSAKATSAKASSTSQTAAGNIITENPWRAACFFLIVILSGLIVLIVLYLRYQRRCRFKLRPRRIR